MATIINTVQAVVARHGVHTTVAWDAHCIDAAVPRARVSSGLLCCIAALALQRPWSPLCQCGTQALEHVCRDSLRRLQWEQDKLKPAEKRMFAAEPVVDRDGKLQTIVICTPGMAADARKYGHEAVWIMDSTFGTNAYGFPLFTFSVADERGQGRQTGFVIVRAENEYNLSCGMTTLLEHIRAGGDFLPQSVMSDCCATIRASVR